MVSNKLRNSVERWRLVVLADDLARPGVEGGEEASGAVSLVVVGAPLHLTRTVSLSRANCRRCSRGSIGERPLDRSGRLEPFGFLSRVHACFLRLGGRGL
jgi:hypothetical protein